ncbi:MAG: HAD family phosphatase [Spirochaetales bacterium]|nr:HAD family phosphatase [Spirochaetales bacterium]
MSIKAVVFDLDGTLIDSERIFSEYFAASAAELGWELEIDTITECIGTSAAETEAIIRNAMGIEFPFVEVRAATEKKFFNLVKINGVPFKKGALRLLDILDGKNIPYALATSTKRHMVEKKFDSSSILKRFSAVLCGDEVDNLKPDPEIYIKVSEKMKLEPSETLVFEDSIYGLLAAIDAGARTVWVPDIQEIADNIRNRCFKEIGSLDAVCDQIGDFLE